MPGYIIHAACGKKLIELLNLQDEKEKKNLIAGSVMPDAAKISGLGNASELDKKQHYALNMESYFKTPDLKKFFSKHPLSLKDYYYIGYALHLYIDIKFDEFISGKATYIPQSFTDGVMFEFQGNKYTSMNFWSMIYEDYDNSNIDIITKYDLDLNDFPELSELKICSKQIPWYGKLNESISQKFTQHSNGPLVFFSLDEIYAFIDNTTEEFKKCYIDTIKSDASTNQNVQRITTIFSGIKKKKNKWYSDEGKRKYYLNYWRELVNKHIISPNDECFMEIVIEEILCYDNHSQKHKKNNKYSLFILSLIPVIVAMLSAASTLDFSLFFDCIKLFKKYEITPERAEKILAYIASVLSVAITVCTQYFEKANYKETWLRYRYIYSMLMNETECFCERLGRYSELDDNKAVKLFMSRINKWRNEDYKTFQNNMGEIDYFENSSSDSDNE